MNYTIRYYDNAGRCPYSCDRECCSLAEAEQQAYEALCGIRASGTNIVRFVISEDGKEVESKSV